MSQASQSKTIRWLDLVSFLSSQTFPVARRDVFEHVSWYRERIEDDETDPEHLRRTFTRDLAELRDWGIGIETVALPADEPDGAQFGYRLNKKELYLPHLLIETDPSKVNGPYAGLDALNLTREDVALIDRATRRLAERSELSLSAAARSLRRKLEFELPLLPEQIERVLNEPAAAGRDGVKELSVIEKGISRTTAVRVNYYTVSRDERAERVLEPHGLFVSWGRWYCVALPRDRETSRVFRVDRMSDVRLLTGREGKFVAPAHFDIREYTNRPPWALSDTPGEEVAVRFAFPHSRWIAAQGVAEGIGEVEDDGAAVMSFNVKDRGPFLRWLLTFANQATVLTPEAVALALAGLKSEIVALYMKNEQ